jgi:hypothetical protein
VSDCFETLTDFYKAGTTCMDKINKEETTIKFEIKKQTDKHKILIEEMEAKHDSLRENVIYLVFIYFQYFSIL